MRVVYTLYENQQRQAPSAADLLRYEATCGVPTDDLPFRVLADQGSVVPNLFPGSNNLPLGVVLDRQMIVQAKGDGAVVSRLQAWVNEALGPS